MVANYPYDNYPSGVNADNSATDDNALFIYMAETYSFNHANMRYGKI